MIQILKGGYSMMYPFLTLPDDTEIVHSHLYTVDGKDQVKVYIETPIYMGFKHATCFLPEYRWENIDGYTEQEMDKFKEIISNAVHVIIRLAREGGVEGNLVSAAKYHELEETIENDYLLQLVEQNHSQPTIPQEEVFASYGLTLDDIRAVEVEIE